MSNECSSVGVARLLRELGQPSAFARPVERVEVLQTHISLLFFAGERVYKVKKPVDLGFLDFTRLEQRRHFCEEELRLNRRLAPEVYLAVVPIVRSGDGTLRVGGEGEVVDWAVEMVRLPAERMLAALLDRGEIDNEQMNATAALLARFHAEAPTGSGVDEYGEPDAIASLVEENFEQLEPFCSPEGLLTPSQHAFSRGKARAFLESHRDLLERRVREGRVRDGHGDLHAENICFTDTGVVAYDCIEFSRAFRCADVAADISFLAMDLDYRGCPGFSGYLMKRYARESGDGELPRLEAFYKGYRATVRGKVAALTSLDAALDPASREEHERKAMRYLQLAAAYELSPALILTCGLPASGKSWLGKRLAGALRAAVLRTDVRRKLLAGLEPTARAGADYGAGLYSEEKKEAIYGALLADALSNLEAGHSTIVDATFSRRHYRARFVDAAERLGLPYYVVHVTAPDALVRERLARRAAEGSDASDAGLDVYLREREAFEPPTEVPREHVLEVVSGEGAPERKSSVVIDHMISLQD